MQVTTGDSGIYYCTASSSDGVSKTASVQIQVIMTIMMINMMVLIIIIIIIIIMIMIMTIKVMFPPEIVSMERHWLETGQGRQVEGGFMNMMMMMIFMMIFGHGNMMMMMMIFGHGNMMMTVMMILAGELPCEGSTKTKVDLVQVDKSTSS